MLHQLTFDVNNADTPTDTPKKWLSGMARVCRQFVGKNASYSGNCFLQTLEIFFSVNYSSERTARAGGTATKVLVVPCSDLDSSLSVLRFREKQALFCPISRVVNKRYSCLPKTHSRSPFGRAGEVSIVPRFPKEP